MAATSISGKQVFRVLPLCPVIMRGLAILAMGGLLSLLLIGCSGASTPFKPASPTATQPTPTLSPEPPLEPSPEPSLEPSPNPATSAVPAATTNGPQGPSSGATIVLSDDSVARYRVREQLARLDLPNDAVGETSAVEGAFSFDDEGSVRSDASKVTVDLRALRSDSDRRDGFLRDRSLQSDLFPLAEFVVRETPGLVWPLPTDGRTLEFQITGDMTLHGVTRPLS